MRLRLFLAIAFCLAFTVGSFSLPRFSSRMNLPCQSCHINPSGGGMRNTFGANFGRDDISVKAWQEDYALDEFSTKLTNFISYGADFRFLTFYQSKTNPDASLSSFFPMQMDVYFNLAISKKINLYVNPAFGPYGRLEMFGIAKVLPLNGYLKLGRFAPSHGLRYDDHTSFIRQATPFRNYGGQQTGMELGLNPGPISMMGAVTNGMRGDLDGGLAGIGGLGGSSFVHNYQNCLTTNPLFKGTGNFPYSLQSSSPCINTGKPDMTGMNIPSLDMAGNPRICPVCWVRIDMGAYEYQ